MDVLLNAMNAPIDGADVRFLNYNPSLLEVQDQDLSAEGVQIAPGSLMPVTMSNKANTDDGKIEFSQIVTGGHTFTNNTNQPLASVTFKVIGSGAAALNLNFVPGITNDANIASKGVDILESVSGSAFTLEQAGSGFRSGVQSLINKFQDLIIFLWHKLLQLFL